LDDSGKIYWHEAFFEALQLVLHQYEDLLKYESEYQLSKEALIVDVLIIKKAYSVQISKDIGKIFRGHNLVEFKSEKDSFSVRDYNKVIGYAHLYSSFEDIPISDITITIALTMFPRELVKVLKHERQLNVRDMENGIYYVEGDAFPVQILESKKLAPDNLFLRNLRSNLSAEDAMDTVHAYEKLKIFEKKNVYIDRLIGANAAIFREVMTVSDTVKELFLEVAAENGWFEEEAKKIAKRMLLLGRPVEEVVEATELPVEIVRGLA